MSAYNKQISVLLRVFSKVGRAPALPWQVLPTKEACVSRKLKRVPLELVDGPANNPRSAIDETELADLAASIAQEGQHTPVFALSVPKARGRERYEVVAGERRFRALRSVAASEIDLIIIGEKGRVSELDILKAQLTENVNRSDMSVMDLARAAGRLNDEFKQPAERIATLLGKSLDTVYVYLRLLTMPAELQGAVELKSEDPDSLPLSVAKLIVKLKPEKQVDAWKEIKRRGKSAPTAQAVVQRRLERVQDRAEGTKSRPIRHADRFRTLTQNLTSVGELVAQWSVLDLTDVLASRSSEDLDELRELLNAVTDRLSAIRQKLPRRR